MHPHLKQKVINIPDLKKGTTIYLSYLREIWSPPLEEEFWLVRDFGGREPVKEATLRVITWVNEDINYEGSIEPEIEEDGLKVYYTWSKENILPVTGEVGSPSLEDMVDVVSVSSLDSWDKFSNWYRQKLENRYNITGEQFISILELTEGMENRQKITKSIYNFVKSRSNYIDIQYDYHFIPREAAGVYKNPTGDSKDLAILLISLLRRLGIEAEPGLVCLRNNVNLDLDVPNPALFKYMVVYVPEFKLFLDPSPGYTGFGELSPYIQGKKVLLPYHNKTEEVPVLPPEFNKEVINQEVNLLPGGTATVNIYQTTGGSFSTYYKKIYSQYSPEQWENLLNSYIQTAYDRVIVDEYNVSGVTGLDNNFSSWARSLEVEGYAKKLDDSLIFSSP